jgi:hypothetical protein
MHIYCLYAYTGVPDTHVGTNWFRLQTKKEMPIKKINYDTRKLPENQYLKQIANNRVFCIKFSGHF